MTSPALQDIVALLGCPAAGNPAQYLFERAIAAAGLDWRFLTCEVAPERLGEALGGIAALGFRGCLLSGPLREAAFPLLASASPASRFAGAASLVDAGPDGLVGHVTDGRGIVEALRTHADLAAARVLLVGAGVTGRATALELALGRAPGIVIADRDPGRAARLAETLQAIEGCGTVECLASDGGLLEIPDSVGVVIATPPDGETVPRLAGLRSDLVLVDTALVDQPAALVAAGREAGCCVVDGLEIHVEKTAIDFQTLTGVETDPDMLREALEEFLS